MKVRILLTSIILALILSFSFGTAVYAGGPPEPSGSDTEVVITPPTVTGIPNIFYVPGSQWAAPLTVSGKITITSEALARGLFSFAYADSNGGYTLVGPNGQTLSLGSHSQSDSDFGWLRAEADASQVYTWTYTFVPKLPGYYTTTQYGDAEAWWFAFFKAGHSSDSDSWMSKFLVTSTVTAPGFWRHTMLWIVLADGSSTVFWASDGFNSGVVSKDIVYTQGKTTVKIPAGTTIQMDGSGQLQMWLIFDAQGNITGRYGYNLSGMGTSLAKTVTFSPPISFTTK